MAYIPISSNRLKGRVDIVLKHIIVSSHGITYYTKIMNKLFKIIPPVISQNSEKCIMTVYKLIEQATLTVITLYQST